MGITGVLDMLVVYKFSEYYNDNPICGSLSKLILSDILAY